MENVSVQLTIEKAPGEAQKMRLQRRDVLTAGELPCEVGGENGAGPLFTLKRQDAAIVVLGDVLVNGKAPADGQALKVGDLIKAGEYEFRFYIKRPYCPLSFTSRHLATVAKCAVALFIAVEIWIMCGLPSLLVEASFWDGSIAVQRIVQRIDRLRKRAAAVNDDAPLKRVIAAEIVTDLNERSRYVKAYDRRIRRGQRRIMLAELERIEKLLDRLESEENLEVDNIREPGLDKAVKRILQEKK